MAQIIDQILADRAMARVQSPKESYPILTRIAGDYELSTKGQKKAKDPDTVVIEIIRGLVAGNKETVDLLRKSQNAGEHDAEILRLETQNVLLSKYLPELLNEGELTAILAELGDVSIGEYQKHLRENYANRFKPGTAAQVYNQQRKG